MPPEADWRGVLVAADHVIGDHGPRRPGCRFAPAVLWPARREEDVRHPEQGLDDGRLVKVAAVAPRGVASTSGAGDALFASFLHGWLACGNPVTALEDAVPHAGWRVGDTFPGVVSLTEAELAWLRTAYPATTVLGRWDTAA